MKALIHGIPGLISSNFNDIPVIIRMDMYDRIKNLKIMLVDDDECIRDSLTLF